MRPIVTLVGAARAGAAADNVQPSPWLAIVQRTTDSPATAPTRDLPGDAVPPTFLHDQVSERKFRASRSPRSI